MYFQKTTSRTIRSSGDILKTTQLRDEIVAQMEGEFIITEVPNFVKFYLPFEPTDDDVKAFVKTCSENEAIICDTDHGPRFTYFMVAPSRDIGTDKAYFRPLQTIADRISLAEVNDRIRNDFNFRFCPETLIASDIPGSNNIIDACITKDTKAAILNSTDIAVVLEFKIKAADQIENNTQAISANVQIMNDDARRMFTFGITIVRDEVTLWYHSRSHSAVSESFSFVQNPKLFIKVLMSFLFATEEELGYDPMVIRESEGTYLFKMPGNGKPDRFFRTEQTLSEYRSSNITGHMARVWQVREYSSPDATGAAKARHVLKDVWLDASASTEKEIQDSIFKDINKFFNSSHEMDPMSMFEEATFETLQALVQNEGYKDYFIKISADYIGKTSKPLAPGSKRKMGLFLSEASTAHGISPREFTSKRQYRVVFDEICRTVGELETLGEVVDVLQETLVALQLMYCAGWVHRDISSGNILAHRKGSGKWQSKLSDLEYARRYPPPSDYNGAADPKTGTPYFMPHEILELKFIYSFGQDKYFTGSYEDRKYDFDVDELDEDGPESTVTQPAPHLIYNFQHDLESIWWILVWTLTARVSHDPSILFASKIFQNRTSLCRERANCILEDITKRLRKCLEISLLRFVRPLEILRLAMYTNYGLRAKKDELLVPGSYKVIHTVFDDFFRKINPPNSNNSNWRTMPLGNNERQPPVLAPQRPSQPGSSSGPNVPQPGRNKRARMHGNADYDPPESEESEPDYDWDHSEDEMKGKGKKKMGTMSRKKPRTADKETGAQ